MAYTKTAAVTNNVDDAEADQYNSLMAEVKAAAEGISTHDCDYVLAYNSDGTLNTITITDNSPAGDAGFDITLVGTCTWSGGKLTQIAWVFNAGEMNITQTEAFTYTAAESTPFKKSLPV